MAQRAPPAHLYPFLNYLANDSIYVPGLVSQVQPSASTEESMDEWMRKMSLTLGSAFEDLLDGVAGNTR